MKYHAVIFDLGGTLSRSAAWEDYRNAALKMSAILNAPPEKYVEHWFADSTDLGTGVYKTWQDYIKHIGNLMGLEVSESQAKKAADIPLSVTRHQICEPRQGAVELLAYLKSSGYKLGLISDCYYDVPQIWPETPFAPYFDVTVFSCEVGMNKADPRIFQIALKKLAVNPENCLYIADGMRNELANATGLGMKAVQLLVPGESYDSPIREDWQGQSISSLQEVHNLLK